MASAALAPAPASAQAGIKRDREDDAVADAPDTKEARGAEPDSGPEDAVHALHARAPVRQVDAHCLHYGGFTHQELNAAFTMSYDTKARRKTAKNRETYQRLLNLVKDKNASVSAETHLEPLWYTGHECPCGFCFGLFENIRYPGPHPLEGCYYCEAPIAEVNEDEDDGLEFERIEEVLCRACYDKAAARGLCKNCNHLLDAEGKECEGGFMV